MDYIIRSKAQDLHEWVFTYAHSSILLSHTRHKSRADGMEPSPVDTLLAGKFSSFPQQEYRKGVKADMSIRRQIEVLNIMGNSLVIN